MASLMLSYLDGEPISVDLPNGDTMLVVGLTINQTGISWMDDGFLDPQPGHPPDHHLWGLPGLANGEVMLQGHRFYVSNPPEEAAWMRWLATWDVDQVHEQAEAALRLQRIAMAGGK